MSKPNYSIYDETDQYLVLKDDGPWDRYPTITNRVEQVVRDIALYLDGRRLYYYDSEGQLDEILVAGGEFNGFAPGGPQT